MAENAKQTSFNQVDWERLYNTTDYDELDSLIEKFINEFLVSNNIPTNIGFKNSLKKQLEAFGGEGLTNKNPFLGWIKQYNTKVGGLSDITDSAYQNLIDIYAKNIILDEDLEGTGSVGTKSLLFTSSLFKKPTKDFTYLVQVFYYYATYTGINTFKDVYKAMKPKQLEEFSSMLGYRLNKNTINIKDEDIKYLFTFSGSKYSVHGELRDINKINSSIRYLDSLNIGDSKNKENREMISSNKYEPKLQAKVDEVREALIAMRFSKKTADKAIDLIIETRGIDNSINTQDLLKLTLNLLNKAGLK